MISIEERLSKIEEEIYKLKERAKKLEQIKEDRAVRKDIGRNNGGHNREST